MALYRKKLLTPCSRYKLSVFKETEKIEECAEDNHRNVISQSGLLEDLQNKLVSATKGGEIVCIRRDLRRHFKQIQFVDLV